MKIFQKLGIFVICGMCGVISVACSDDKGSVPPPAGEDEIPVNEPVEFTNAGLVYYGMGGITESCEFEFTFYTDMEIDPAGNPIGPGKVMRLNFNATPFEDGETAFVVPSGRYSAAQTSYTFSPFTFNWGYMTSYDLPSGTVEIPKNSFYGELAEGETVFEPDLLNYGAFDVQVAADGTYTIVGCVVGCGKNATFRKRNFTYTGKIETVDSSDDISATGDTTLDADLVLGGFTKARLKDQGDLFYLQDNSYRAFDLWLGDDAADFENEWPSSGSMLKVTFLVPFDAAVADGVPAGEYVMMTDRVDGGIDRTEIVPYKLRPGVAGQYTHPSGSWYLSYADGALSKYARISAGKVSVERTGDAHTFVIDLSDCASEPHKVTCRYSQSEPVEVYTYKF